MKMRPPQRPNGDLSLQGTAMMGGRAPPRRPSTTTMRRSESIGALPRAAIQGQPKRIPMNPPPNYCVPSVQLSKNRDEQYARSLEQQVQLLELENRYLLQTQSVPAPPTESHSYSHILSRGNEVSLNGRDWCQLPSFHPPIEKVLADRIGKAAKEPSIIKESSFDTMSSVPPTRDTVRRTSTVTSNRVVGSPESRVSFPQIKSHSPDAALLQELEQKNQEVQVLRSELEDQQRRGKQSEDRLNQLTIRLREAESDLSSRSEADTRDKRALMEETLELQRRLNDLTPVLAEKESRIARIEDDKDALVARLRTANSEISQLKLTISERSRQEELHLERESSGRAEIARLRETLEEARNQSEIQRKREEDLLEELSSSQRRVKEVQLRHNNDKTVVEQLNSENNKLISENSRLTTEVARMEYNMEKLREEESSRSSRRTYTEEQFTELRLNSKTLETQITISEERLKAAVARCESLEKEIEERSGLDSDARNERSRMQKELEALQALSRSLSTENKSLREEKMALLDKVEALKSKVTAREIQIKNMEDEMANREQKYEEEARKAERESETQSQRALELEELSRRVRELSQSIPAASRSPATRAPPTKEATRPSRQPPGGLSKIPIMEEMEYECGKREMDRVIHVKKSSSEHVTKTQY